MDERTIFLNAIELADPQQRREYVAQACGEDAQLRERVQALLVSHDASDTFLKTPVPEQLGSLPPGSMSDHTLLNQESEQDGG